MRKYKYTQLKKPIPDGYHVKTKLYTIYLAPGCTHSFTSERQAQKFAAAYSREINRTIHLYNILLTELYNAHRAAWFYYYDAASGKNNTDIEKSIQNLITDIEINMHRSIHYTSGTNISSQIWNLCVKISADLQNGFNKLSAFLYARRLYAESERCEIFCSQAQNEIARICGLFDIEL